MAWEQVELEELQLGRHRTDWDTLSQRYYQGHPFTDSRFVNGLLRHFGRGTERLFVHRRDDGTVDGMVLLEPRRFGVWRQFMPAQLQAGLLLIPNSTTVRQLFEALPTTGFTIEFLQQDPKYQSLDGLDCAPDVRIQPHCTTMEVRLDGTFSDYWSARSRNLTKNIRRIQRRVQTQCTSAVVKEIRDRNEMAAAVQRYGLLESAGWKHAAGTALAPNNAQGRFYTEIMQQFAETGQATAFEFWIDRVLAASRLLVSGAGIQIILKTSYDEQLSQFAPGRLLLQDLLERSFAAKAPETIEFYTNATQDQLAWATHQRPISHVTYFRYGVLASAHDLYRRLRAGRKRLTSSHFSTTD